ncbi:hypothetical protein HEP_00409900, partial [Hepatocystis sp. ex Piliocolobus tephrosceles]
NINTLVVYFNQRNIDKKMVEYLKNQMKPKKRKRRLKNKELLFNTKTADLSKKYNSIPPSITNCSQNDIEEVQKKAEGFAFVGYNQKRLLTQITPCDYKSVLNLPICNKIFTIKWKEQQNTFINHLYHDLVPDSEEIKKHFENIYIRYMGYDKKKKTVKIKKKSKSNLLKNAKDGTEGGKTDNKYKTRKKNIDKNNETMKKNTKIKRPRKKLDETEIANRKYKRTKLKTKENIETNNNTEEIKNVEQNENITNTILINELENMKKQNKTVKEKKKKNKHLDLANDDLTNLTIDQDKILQASLEFMNPNLFT